MERIAAATELPYIEIDSSRGITLDDEHVVTTITIYILGEISNRSRIGGQDDAATNFCAEPRRICCSAAVIAIIPSTDAESICPLAAAIPTKAFVDKVSSAISIDIA